MCSLLRKLILSRRGVCVVSGKSFVKGAVVLSVAGILAKCLGALYRIPFGTIVSEDCLALYTMVYPIYHLRLALSTAGIPLAISKFSIV